MPTVNINYQNLLALGSDVGLLQTNDGKKMIDLWLEVIMPSLAEYNAMSNNMANFFGSRADVQTEQVVQTIGSKWQRATEITKAGGEAALRRWIVRYATLQYKTGMGHTRKFIEQNTSAHIVAQFNSMLKGWEEQKYAEIISAFYSKGVRNVVDDITHETLQLFGLVDGSGNMPIPSLGTNTFAPNHNHYTYLDSTTDNWTDVTKRQKTLKNLIKLVTEHGYRKDLVLIGNSVTIDDIKDCPGFRALVGLSKFASSDTAALHGTDTQVVIRVFEPIASIARVIGTVENVTVLECDYLPIGYLACFAYNGQGSPENPVGFREEAVRTFSDNPFPYYETMMESGFSATVRKRLNGAVLYLASGANAYVNPSIPTLANDTGDWDGNLSGN